ncbi:hypothetical protein V5O48_019695, partial [Marasmius crinis-equi]
MPRGLIPNPRAIKYNPGHSLRDGCCNRIHATHFEYVDVINNNLRVRVAAFAVNGYLKFAHDAWRLQRFPDWHPDQGYWNFAMAFNNCVSSHKFPIYALREGGEYDTVLTLDLPPPSIDELMVDVHQCFEGDFILRPGYVAVKKEEYESLTKLAADQALWTTKHR